jgi:Terminase large subunit, T4likevirus-type, N-terminal
LNSKADILFFGGAAGGGKTWMLLGLAGSQHRRSIIFRREFKQLEDIRGKAEQLYTDIGSFNGQRELWRLDYNGIKRRVRFGAMQLPGDEMAYQGQQADLMAFDEITHFAEQQFRFVTGWNRSDVPGQRSRVIAAGNPPTNAEGYWVIKYWAPWLDPKYPNPAKDGELRWFAQIKDKTGRFVDMEVGGPAEIEIPGEPYPVKPRSRTFIRAFLTDNPVYMASGYMAVLQGMPEPLRSQMLHGDFLVGHEDHPRQVIPTEWVISAQARWRPKDELDPRIRMDALGVDVARGGKDNFVMTPRYGTWFDEQISYPGSETPDGFRALEFISKSIPVGERPAVNIDVVGIGSSVYDIAKAAGLNAFAMDARHTSYGRDSSGALGFTRKKAEWWWKLRESLDPAMGDDLAIPPDRQLMADLTAPRYEMKTNGIQIEDKEDLIARIGRSPDYGDSLVLAHARSVLPIATHLL